MTAPAEATGQVEIAVPRDRDGSFELQVVKARQQRLTGVDQIVLSLYAKGLTIGEISAHFAEINGASVSKETTSRITDKVMDEMSEWATASRPARQGASLSRRPHLNRHSERCLGQSVTPVDNLSHS